MIFAKASVKLPLYDKIILPLSVNVIFRFSDMQGGNPNSGTVVDDVVTLPERYDFFLVSQSVNQVIKILQSPFSLFFSNQNNLIC